VKGDGKPWDEIMGHVVMARWLLVIDSEDISFLYRCTASTANVGVFKMFLWRPRVYPRTGQPYNPKHHTCIGTSARVFAQQFVIRKVAQVCRACFVKYIVLSSSPWDLHYIDTAGDWCTLFNQGWPILQRGEGTTNSSNIIIRMVHKLVEHKTIDDIAVDARIRNCVAYIRNKEVRYALNISYVINVRRTTSCT
jgi:hypothetical protein